MTLSAGQRTRLLRFSIAGAAVTVAGAAILMMWIPEHWAEFLGSVLVVTGGVMLGMVLAVIALDSGQVKS
jgi:hypothetical protein